LEEQKEKGGVKEEGNGGRDERAKESFQVKGMYVSEKERDQIDLL